VITIRMCAQRVGSSDPLDDMLAIQCCTTGGLMGVPKVEGDDRPILKPPCLRRISNYKASNF
jgi:hypothetical protein